MAARPRRRPVVLNRDHARPRTAPAPTVAAVEERRTALIGPALVALGDEYRRLGCRARGLTLPVMVAVVLTLIWHQVPSVTELVRTLEPERVRWAPPLQISPQAVSLRRRSLAASLVSSLVHQLLPVLPARAAARTRPLPPGLERGRPRFPQIWAMDGSTWEPVFGNVGRRRDATTAPLGGTLAAGLDVRTKLPVQLWLEPDPHANDQQLLDRIKEILPPGGLLILDRGFYTFPCFDWLTDHDRWCITRPRAGAAMTIVQVRTACPGPRDQIVPGPTPASIRYA